MVPGLLSLFEWWMRVSFFVHNLSLVCMVLANISLLTKISWEHSTASSLGGDMVRYDRYVEAPTAPGRDPPINCSPERMVPKVPHTGAGGATGR